MIYHDTTAIQAVNEGRDVPDGFYDPKHPSILIGKREYVSTDGWRGYNKIVPEPGYRVVDDDWLTGDWEDAPAGHSESEVQVKLKKLEQDHGDVYVIFTPTSNVFSTGYDVLVRDTGTPIIKGKLIGHKTRKFTEPDGSWRVRYHATDVVRYDAKTGKYTLNTGGWNTLTTSKRMSEALPAGYYTYRRNWVMYVHTPDGDLEIKDGMEI